MYGLIISALHDRVTNKKKAMLSILYFHILFVMTFGTNNPLYCFGIALGSDTHDSVLADICQQTDLPKGFPLPNIRNMHLHHRDGHYRHCVAQGYAGVGISPCVQHDAVVSVYCIGVAKSTLLQTVYQASLVITLVVVQRHLGELPTEVVKHIFHGLATIDIGLASP